MRKITKHKERKRNLDSLKSRQMKTSIDVWFVVNSIRLAKAEYSVRNVNRGHMLLIQDTMPITWAVIVMMAQIKCCILPRIMSQRSSMAGQFVTVTCIFVMLLL
jgi:hypothetical protein